MMITVTAEDVIELDLDELRSYARKVLTGEIESAAYDKSVGRVIARLRSFVVDHEYTMSLGCD